MPTTNVGGLRATITARDTGFQAAANRTVRSLNTVQTTAARVQRSFASQSSAARQVTRSYQGVANSQANLSRASTVLTANLTASNNSIRRATTSLRAYIGNLNATQVATVALNATTAALSGNMLRVATTAAAAFGPQAALVSAAISTGRALLSIGTNSERAATGIERMSVATGRLNSLLDRVTSAAVFVGLAAAAGRLVTGFTDAVDSITNLRNRINLVSNAGDDAAETLERLRQVAEGTRTSLQSTGELYTRLAEALQGSLPTNELLAITETIQRTVVLSGVSAQSAQAALTQLAQGLAAGALRGEELNSVLEQLPRATRVLTDELGVNIGQLRELAEQGALTTDVIARAFANQAVTIETEFATQATTVEQALTVASDKFVSLLNSMNESVALTRVILFGISAITTVFTGWETIFNLLSRGFTSLADVFRSAFGQGPQLAEALNPDEGPGIRDLVSDYVDASEAVNRLRESQKAAADQYRMTSARVRELRAQLANVDTTPGLNILEREGARFALTNRLDDAIVQQRAQQEVLAIVNDRFEEQNTVLMEVTENMQSFIIAAVEAREAIKSLEEQFPGLSFIEQLDAALDDEGWRAYIAAVNDGRDAVERFFNSAKNAAEEVAIDGSRLRIDQLDAAISDEQFLQRQKQLLEDSSQIAEFFKEEVVDTVDEYARWISEQQRLNAEFQKAIDLAVAETGERIAGAIVFTARQEIDDTVTSIDQLDEALTDNQWLNYADAVREAESAVATFRANNEGALNIGGNRANLEIDQLDALLGDEQHLQYIQELLRQNAQIAEFFKVETEETVNEYDRWIERMQRLHEEAQSLVDIAVGDVGERIAGSVNFIEQSVVQLSDSLNDLDAALSDEEWIRYRDVVNEARVAIDEFYESRRRVISNPEDLTIDQLNARLDDETHLQMIQQILEDNADIARFFTQETKDTVSEYDRWIERMRELHQEAQSLRDLAVAETAEQLAGAVTFNAASRLSADRQTIDELDAALTDEQWVQYREAVDAAAEAIDRFRDSNKTAFERAEEDVEAFSMALNTQISSSLADAITGVESFGDAFRNVASFIIRRLIEMTLEATIFKNALEGGGAGGGILGIFDNILEFFNLPTRQLGGPVSANTPYLVGEAGPEVFLPSTSGSIIPNSQIGGGGGVGPLTINVNGVQDPTIVRAAVLDEVPYLIELVKGNFANDMIRPSVARTAARVGVR